MQVYREEIALSTQGQTDVLDITAHVREAVRASGVAEGMAVVFTPSSTSAITTLEYEPGCVQDLRRLMEEWIDSRRDYAHNRRWGDGNGHAHLRAAMVGPSLALPVHQGEPELGTWQQIVFVDFDVRPRQRRVVVQVVGQPSA